MNRSFALVCARVMFVRWSGVVSGALLVACGGDDLTYGPADAGTDAPRADATLPDASVPDAPPADAGDAATPTRLLLSMNNTTTSELVVLNVGSRAVDGRIAYQGRLGTTFTRGDEPWLMEQHADIVAKLDAKKPWQIVSSWAVGLSDRKDGGESYSDPYAVLVPAGGKGYVLRYTRNQIAVIDTTQVADGGAPTGTVDLSSLVQSADGDGTLEMTTGFYVASKNMVYVLLANIDRTKVATDGFTILCATTTETLIGIDTLTSQVTNLGGTGPGGGIALTGYNPAISLAGVSAVYDAANDRILVVHSGCNTPLADGGTGEVKKRIVEEVALKTGQTKVLLDASALGFPGSFSYLGPHDAFLGYGSDVRRWDPTQTTIGAIVPAAVDSYAFASDGTGGLFGTHTVFEADGGSTIAIVRADLQSDASTTLATNPFTDNSGFVGGIGVWPAP